jgi:hypothetical protein
MDTDLKLTADDYENAAAIVGTRAEELYEDAQAIEDENPDQAIVLMEAHHYVSLLRDKLESADQAAYATQPNEDRHLAAAQYRVVEGPEATPAEPKVSYPGSQQCSCGRCGLYAGPGWLYGTRGEAGPAVNFCPGCGDRLVGWEDQEHDGEARVERMVSKAEVLAGLRGEAAPAEPQYDPTVPPIEDTIQAIAAQVPQEEWDKLYAERTVRLADVLAVVEESKVPNAPFCHLCLDNIAERIAELGGGSSE